jgi:hypothetical protein
MVSDHGASNGTVPNKEEVKGDERHLKYNNRMRSEGRNNIKESSERLTDHCLFTISPIRALGCFSCLSLRG